jgi:signal transduction histidine kinase
MRQVLFNLLSNAIKFTPDGGRIRIVARRLGESHVRVAVTDSGPGVAPEHPELIFEKFRQIDQSVTREHHGSGLGLAIAKELTYLLGGEIGVESRPERGATFWITLPTTAPEQRDQPLIPLV